MVAASILFVVHFMFCMVLTYTDVFSHDLCRNLSSDEPARPPGGDFLQNEPKAGKEGLLCAGHFEGKLSFRRTRIFAVKLETLKPLYNNHLFLIQVPWPFRVAPLKPYS